MLTRVLINIGAGDGDVDDSCYMELSDCYLLMFFFFLIFNHGTPGAPDLEFVCSVGQRILWAASCEVMQLAVFRSGRASTLKLCLRTVGRYSRPWTLDGRCEAPRTICMMNLE